MPRIIKLGSRTFTLPDYAPARILIGILLVIGGILGYFSYGFCFNMLFLF